MFLSSPWNMDLLPYYYILAPVYVKMKQNT